MKRLPLLLSLLVAVPLPGCLVRGDLRTRSYVESSAELVYVSPGVYAVADYDEPVFYADSYYWVNRGGHWYRSGYYTSGWVQVGAAPTVVMRIQQPRAYVHYRGTGQARIRARDHRRDRREDRRDDRGRSRVRDHR